MDLWVILYGILRGILSMGKCVNFNTILGEIYDMDFDEILSDYRGESYLSIKKNRVKNRAVHLCIHAFNICIYFVPIIPIFPYIFVIKSCGGGSALLPAEDTVNNDERSLDLGAHATTRLLQCAQYG